MQLTVLATVLMVLTTFPYHRNTGVRKKKSMVSSKQTPQTHVYPHLRVNADAEGHPAPCQTLSRNLQGRDVCAKEGESRTLAHELLLISQLWCGDKGKQMQFPAANASRIPVSQGAYCLLLWEARRVESFPCSGAEPHDKMLRKQEVPNTQQGRAGRGSVFVLTHLSIGH